MVLELEHGNAICKLNSNARRGLKYFVIQNTNFLAHGAETLFGKEIAIISADMKPYVNNVRRKIQKRDGVSYL